MLLRSKLQGRIEYSDSNFQRHFLRLLGWTLCTEKTSFLQHNVGTKAVKFEKLVLFFNFCKTVEQNLTQIRGQILLDSFVGYFWFFMGFFNFFVR
jgi:hypothetical protein